MTWWQWIMMGLAVSLSAAPIIGVWLRRNRKRHYPRPREERHG